MGLHKLSAGDGYLYLIRQVAASDDTHRGKPSLADYYSEKGESPGRWMGSGLPGLGEPVGRDPSDPMVAELWAVPEGSEVTEDQMKALFGEGLHPNADRITERLTGFGIGHQGAIAAARLGRPFRVNKTDNEWMRRLREGYADFNATLGRDRQASLEPEERASIKTAVAREMFVETYGRPPADERELTGFVARKSRAQTQAVAGYDLTFTPVKSVSALWALAPREISEQVLAAHHRAVADAIAFLEEHAAFSRMGANGIAQVDTTGFIAAAFDHRDSRAGDPNLHTHVAISNKVRVIGADGIPRWLALDGDPLHKATVAASELYNTRLEAHLMAALGVQFAETRAKNDKRPVREIVGIPTELLERWSARRTAIEHRVADLAKAFQAEHHREPTAVEMLALSQQATLDTRQAKHEPRSLGEQRQTWHTEAIEILGSHRKLTRLITEITSQTRRRRQPAITAEWVSEQAATVIAAVSHDRAEWGINHVRAEAQRVLRNTGRHSDTTTLDRIVAAALGEHSVTITTHADTEMNEPAALRRRDGVSVYTRHDSTRYTSAAIQAAERRILDAAALGGGRVADDNSVGLAMLEQHAQNGLQLNAGQQVLVRGMATSGARLQLALAPAGTGKTTAMSVLAAAWTNSGGNVIGLAPTAAAAEVLAEDAHITTDTMAKFVQLAAPTEHRVAANDPALKWFNKIGPDTLIIVDEAGMASTLDLDEMITHALAKGASVRLIADDQQLASISAGGVITDLASRPETLTLSTVVRFRDPAQSAASLAIRDGDPAGIAYYIDHGRVHVGADQTAADMAYQAWADDIKAGHRSVLLAPTNDLVAELNERARLDRLNRSTNQPSRTVTLADGLTASAGDWIITRKNARWLRLTNGAWIKNGHRWVIRSVRRDGSVTVSRLGADPGAKTIRLPAKYVEANTTLGYASTINAAQGLTAGTQKIKGTCHIVGSDHLTRQQLYVAATRAKDENHIYFSTSEADPHRILAPKATHPPTAVDILTTILRRDGRQVSATTAAQAELDPFTRLHRAASMYADSLTLAAERLAGSHTMARIDQAATAIAGDITDAEAWPVLRRNLALLALDGHDPVAALQHAAAKPLGDTVDVAAVLDWRLPTPAGASAAQVGPLRWLPAIPTAVQHNPQWAEYLAGRAQLVTELADQIRNTAREWTAASAPAWARPLRDAQPQLMAEVAVFRAAHDVDPADTRLTGPEQHANRSAAFQQLINSRVDAAITRDHASAARWRALAATVNPRIPADPFWPRLAAHLDDAARAGGDVTGMLAAAMAAGGPLPDELPAAALWWRLSGTLATPTLERSNPRLRPDWTPVLHHLLGTQLAETVIADPGWPGLIAAVTASGWPPADLLAAATEHLREITETEGGLRPDEYARLLTTRIELLTHAATIDTDIPHPAETVRRPGEQLDLLAEPSPEEAAYTVDDAPPDPYDYAYGYAEDDLGDWDFEDLLTYRPAAPTRPADILALRTARDLARAHVRELEHAILHTGAGPAERAAAAELADLTLRYDQQRPYHHAYHHAHADWVRADRAVETHHRLLETLDAQIAAARAAGHHDLAATYVEYRAELASHTTAIADAAADAKQQRDTTRQALFEAAGGPDRVLTAADIQQHRTTALQADADQLRQARLEATDLDNQLMRAEHAAARTFATRPAADYDLAADLHALRTEIDLLEQAGTRSPAAMYTAPPESLDRLDAHAAHVIADITASGQTVQPLALGSGADKEAVLATLAAAARHNQQRILALPATDTAAAYAAEKPYAHTTTDPAHAHSQLENSRWTLPIGTLIVVDDADHLDTDQLQGLTKAAGEANAKLVLVTNETAAQHETHSQPLVDMLHNQLPWAQSIRAADVDPPEQTRTAIDRVEHHLASTTDTSPAAAEAVRLIERRDDLRREHDYLTGTRGRATIDRSRDRSRDAGLDL
ncbi:relaxase domain-containing protein [Mycobacterium sp. DSM 3803]|nr:relaxase domain-containing protein [Mycobacterium sp. DSM 3803]